MVNFQAGGHGVNTNIRLRSTSLQGSLRAAGMYSQYGLSPCGITCSYLLSRLRKMYLCMQAWRLFWCRSGTYTIDGEELWLENTKSLLSVGALVLRMLSWKHKKG